MQPGHHCTRCDVPLTDDNTYRGKGFRCRACLSKDSMERLAAKPDKAERQMLSNARFRAKRDGLPCNIELSDIIIPTHCPALGIPLNRKGSRGPLDASPTLDKIIPELGYVRGNVCVISARANRIKSDATPAELEAVLRYARGPRMFDAKP